MTPPARLACVGGPLHGQIRAVKGYYLETYVMEMNKAMAYRPEDPISAPSRTITYRRRRISAETGAVSLRLTVLAPEGLRDSEVQRLVKTMRHDILLGGVL